MHRLTKRQISPIMFLGFLQNPTGGSYRVQPCFSWLARTGVRRMTHFHLCTTLLILPTSQVAIQLRRASHFQEPNEQNCLFVRSGLAFHFRTRHLLTHLETSGLGPKGIFSDNLKICQCHKLRTYILLDIALVD